MAIAKKVAAKVTGKATALLPIKQESTAAGKAHREEILPSATVNSYSASEAFDSITRQLARYRSMRNFTVTSEPSGIPTGRGKRAADSQRTKQTALPFVVQKHAASHLHYDFRLGWNGVLKSWACAKGPSYVPSDRRLAVQVEDHPIEYGGFEGVIPAGQYGGGTVMLWDEGIWEPQPGYTDVETGLREGSLKFTLHGSKLKGNWALVRMGGCATTEKKPNWLLIKEHDAFERSKDDKPITEEMPNSVVTNRSLELIADIEDHIWNPSGAPSTDVATHEDRKETKYTFASRLAELPRETLADFIPPQLAIEARNPPSGKGWLVELKLDGYRIQARLENGKAKLLTRTGLDWTHRMSSIEAEVSKLPAKSALLDGEVVVLGKDGNTSFADLQAAFQDGVTKSFTYFAFDILHLNGRDLRKLALRERKAFLLELLTQPGSNLRISEHLESDAGTIFEKACELHAEGIVAKRADSPYRSGKSSSWMKLKCIHKQEFVIGGFTLPAQGHAEIHGVGALLLGYYGTSGKLIYAGRTGTGFSEKVHIVLRTLMESLRDSKMPFLHMSAEARRGAVWVKPKLVAEVRFATWTAEGLLRQASFQGLREDKPAIEVRKEMSPDRPQSVPKRKRSKEAVHSAASSFPANSAPSRDDGALDHPPIRLTHPGKTIDAESGLTKQQLADYYWAIAPLLLPQIAGRPLSLVRCPDGSTQPCFFQRHTTITRSVGTETIEIPDKKTGRSEPYITLSTPEALAGLAQMGVLEMHPWGSCNKDLEHPDRIIFDLDPDVGISWSKLAGTAMTVRERLMRLGLESFLKLTGGKGLHVVVPILPKHDWAAVKYFSHSFALELEKSDPQLFVTKMTKSARSGKIYIDYLRNERGATAVAAYSPRARAGVPVAMPLSWKELKLGDRPTFYVANYASWKRRLSRDPWCQMSLCSQTLPARWVSM